MAELNRHRRAAMVAGIITRLFEVYFVTVVISLFIGFLVMFAADDESMGKFVDGIRYFMYFVLGLVVLGIVYKQVKTRLGEKDPALIKNNTLVISLTLIISAGMVTAAYFIGTRFLGSAFDFSFMLKWGGAILSIFLLLVPYNLVKKTEERFIKKYQFIFFETVHPVIQKDIQFTRDGSLERSVFTDSKLFTFQEIWNYSGSGLWTRNTANFRGSHLRVQQREERRSDGKTEIKISDLFTGYFFTADFNKTFSGETYILPDTTREVMGEVYGEFLNTYFNRPATTLIKLEDPVFEKSFSVYATDPVEARYILSPKLIERINAIKEIFYPDILISFVGNKMYFALRSEKDLFAPSLFGRTDDAILLEKQFNYLRTLLTLPEELDLETRVWG